MRRFEPYSLIIIIIAAIAIAGCGGIPLPKAPDQYSTSVEEGESVDLVHVQFDLLFDAKGASESDILGEVAMCKEDGSCGMMARLAVDGEYLERSFSCACALGMKGSVQVDVNGDGKMEDRQKISAQCIVPVDKGILFVGNKVYTLMLTSVSPQSSTGTELAFTSSPRFELKKGVGVKSIKGYFHLALN